MCKRRISSRWFNSWPFDSLVGEVTNMAFEFGSRKLTIPKKGTKTQNRQAIHFQHFHDRALGISNLPLGCECTRHHKMGILKKWWCPRSKWMFPKIGVPNPQNGWWFIVEKPMNKWMIWGFSHYFWSATQVTQVLSPRKSSIEDSSGGLEFLDAHGRASVFGEIFRAPSGKLT